LTKSYLYDIMHIASSGGFAVSAEPDEAKRRALARFFATEAMC
jgi:hypothetical protein